MMWQGSSAEMTKWCQHSFNRRSQSCKKAAMAMSCGVGRTNCGLWPGRIESSHAYQRLNLKWTRMYCWLVTDTAAAKCVAQVDVDRYFVANVAVLAANATVVVERDIRGVRALETPRRWHRLIMVSTWLQTYKSLSSKQQSLILISRFYFFNCFKFIWQRDDVSNRFRSDSCGLSSQR